jgi:hypothetical protein
MRRDPRFRAFVRFSPNGDIIPMSMVIRKKQPKGRGWAEIDSNFCCLPGTPSPFTLGETTTTSTTTTTTL